MNVQLASGIGREYPRRYGTGKLCVAPRAAAMPQITPPSAFVLAAAQRHRSLKLKVNERTKSGWGIDCQCRECETDQPWRGPAV